MKLTADIELCYKTYVNVLHSDREEDSNNVDFLFIGNVEPQGERLSLSLGKRKEHLL